MTMLRRVGKTDRVDFLVTYRNLAAKLLRTFTLQTEALARLRGQIRQQTVGAQGSGAQKGNRNALRHGYYTANAVMERRILRMLINHYRRGTAG
jgi:hypothetical protein